MNPRPKNDDESKMRGHLGTELGNKVTDTLVSIKKKEAGGQVTFTVQQQDARDKDMEDWQFVVCDAAGALGIPKIINNGNLARTIERIEAEKEMMELETLRVLKTIIMPPQSEYFTNIIRKLKDVLHVGETKAKACWNDLREKHPNLIYQRDGGKFTLSNSQRIRLNNKVKSLNSTTLRPYNLNTYIAVVVHSFRCRDRYLEPLLAIYNTQSVALLGEHHKIGIYIHRIVCTTRRKHNSNADCNYMFYAHNSLYF